MKNLNRSPLNGKAGKLHTLHPNCVERAERGEILAFAGVVQMTGHEVASVTVRGEGGSIFTLLGAAHELAYRICREEIEQR